MIKLFDTPNPPFPLFSIISSIGSFSFLPLVMTMMTGPKILHPPPLPLFRRLKKPPLAHSASNQSPFQKKPFFAFKLSPLPAKQCVRFLCPLPTSFAKQAGQIFLCPVVSAKKRIFYFTVVFGNQREFSFFSRRGSKHVSEFSFLLLFLWGAKVMCRALRNANAEDTKRGF